MRILSFLLYLVDLQPGVRVIKIDPDGPAAGVGVRLFDVITALNHRPTPTCEDFNEAQRNLSPFDDIVFTLRRPQDMTISMSQMPAPARPYQVASHLGFSASQSFTRSLTHSFSLIYPLLFMCQAAPLPAPSYPTYPFDAPGSPGSAAFDTQSLKTNTAPPLMRIESGWENKSLGSGGFAPPGNPRRLSGLSPKASDEAAGFSPRKPALSPTAADSLVSAGAKSPTR